jgi:hypothetical protein
MFDHHDSIGALRHGRSGHNLNRGALLQRTTLPLLTRSHLPHDPQGAGAELRGAHGKSVPRRPVERRLIPVSMNSLSQDTVSAGWQRQHLCRRRCQIHRALQYHRQRFIEANNANRNFRHLDSSNRKAPSSLPGASFFFGDYFFGAL